MSNERKQSTEAAVREIRRRTRRKFSPEEKIRIVLEGLRGEQSISELCRREGAEVDTLHDLELLDRQMVRAPHDAQAAVVRVDGV